MKLRAINLLWISKLSSLLIPFYNSHFSFLATRYLNYYASLIVNLEKKFHNRAHILSILLCVKSFTKYTSILCLAKSLMVRLKPPERLLKNDMCIGLEVSRAYLKVWSQVYSLIGCYKGTPARHPYPKHFFLAYMFSFVKSQLAYAVDAVMERIIIN